MTPILDIRQLSNFSIINENLNLLNDKYLGLFWEYYNRNPSYHTNQYGTASKLACITRVGLNSLASILMLGMEWRGFADWNTIFKGLVSMFGPDMEDGSGIVSLPGFTYYLPLKQDQLRVDFVKNLALRKNENLKIRNLIL